MTSHYNYGRDYAQRRQINDESRNSATHNREPWLSHEDDLILTWSGNEEELRVAAELLGRTVEACRQRYYLVRRYGSHGANARAEHPSASPTPTCPVCGLQHRGEC